MKSTKSSILPFDPCTTKRDAFVIKMTPPMARYILKYHNNDNRELKPAQVNKIDQSVAAHGWLFDGYGCCFNVEGNITEKQHGLTHISKNPDDTAEYDVVIVTGVVLDAFSKGAGAKPRTYHDEIYRKDKTVPKSQSAILNDLMARKGNRPKLSINNAVEYWYIWKNYIISAEKVTSEFFSETNAFSAQKRTIGAWATLCINAGCEEEVKIFLDLLLNELNLISTTRLTSDFNEYWKEYVQHESNEGYQKVLYRLLCVSLDRIITKPSGHIALNMTPAKLMSKNLTGTYQKFLA